MIQLLGTSNITYELISTRKTASTVASKTHERDIEDGKSDVEAIGWHVQGCFQAGETSIGDVRPVQEADEIQETKDRNQSEVELQREPSVVCC